MNIFELKILYDKLERKKFKKECPWLIYVYERAYIVHNR
jgi:hypothetical protein